MADFQRTFFLVDKPLREPRFNQVDALVLVAKHSYLKEGLIGKGGWIVLKSKVSNPK
jgi:hypothetical protein